MPDGVILAVSKATLGHDGLFLIGFGALVVAAALIVSDAPRGLNAHRQAVGTPRQRWGWSLTVVGSTLVGVGSVLVFVGNWPSIWFVVTVSAGALVIWWCAFWWAGRPAPPPNAPPGLPRRLAAFLRTPFGVVLILAVALATALVLLELLSDRVRDWTADRPAVVGIGTSLLIVTPAAFGVERWIAKRDERRWRRAAIDGIETAMWQGNRFNQRLIEIFLAADADVRRDGESSDFRDGMARLAERSPAFFQQLSTVAGEEAERAGELALLVTPALALYKPLAGYGDDLSEVLRMLRRIDDECYGISFLTGHIGGEHEASARELLRKRADAIVDLQYERQEKLIDLRLDLEQLDEVNPPVIAEVQNQMQERLAEDKLGPA